MYMSTVRIGTTYSKPGKDDIDDLERPLDSTSPVQTIQCVTQYQQRTGNNFVWCI
ncbi:hypothetical protein M404DRAFT_1001104 [Pisolithus tinctorius Marx 270]|uniref:Uncharacterized protein n=1 Tax=Pisolithus tinctorius Marx 270 TaxID=870435 RepID=A0A0C3K235_PISTI|nr:hypothetical protein M404DRAFT_1001104 [Pisolithus tinctorius Marx 270]